MEKRQSLPNTDQLSIITATILIGYILLPYLNLPGRRWVLPFSGFSIYFELEFSSLISILLASIAAVGSNWLLKSHPHFNDQPIAQHAILPALTTWVLSIPLGQISLSPQWWVIFGLGSVLLLIIFTAEYIAVDLSDERHALATIGLTAISFALYLFLAISMRGAGLRLYLILPGLGLAIFPIIMRTLYLRLNETWSIPWALSISLVIMQIVLALHYLPLSPVLFGVIILAAAFLLENLAEAALRNQPLRAIWIEPTITALMMIILAIFLNTWLNI
ncbi:MAG: hypothetical protein JW750_12035 [Anaerolineaceae bacterium]|nr:hypothetical protein [Anaerolineaceae bacterium]